MTATNASGRRSLYAAVFLISVASLALQVLQMRMFAFVAWHHLAFLVISIAILGFGAAGAFLSSVRRLRQADAHRSIAIASLLFAVTAYAGPWLLSTEAFRATDIFGRMDASDVLRMGGYYVVFALPYFFAGYVISLALMREAKHVDRLYFVNLVGSGAGCFLLFATLEPLGALRSVAVLTVLVALIGVVVPAGTVLRSISGVVVLLCLAISVNLDVPIVQNVVARFALKVADSKLMATYQRYGMKHLYTRWTPLARIDIEDDPTVKGAMLLQDGDAPGYVPGKDYEIPDSEIHGISYLLTEKPKVLIIGIGGGFDIKWAVDRDASEITAVEINAGTLDLYRNELTKITGNITERENLSLHVAEGRHFVRASHEKYDLIQMSGVDTYTALASGGYVMSESYLYTEEAFNDYLDHLTDDGFFTIIRFAFPAPRETLRVMTIACKVLADRGAKEPWRHVAVIRGGKSNGEDATSLGAILVKKSPFEDAELDKLATWADKYGHEKLYLPGRISGEHLNPFEDFAKHVQDGTTAEFFASYPYNVKPVTDDRPFFFNQHRLGSVWTWIKEILGGTADRQIPKQVPWVALLPDFQKRPMGLMLLVATLVQLTVLIAVLIFGPLVFLRRETVGRRDFVVPMGYFACLGFAYILLMISAMQRFGLILGHPTYAISVTMATFLIGSGVGSFFAGRFARELAPKVVTVVAGSLVVYSALLALLLPGIASVLLTQAFLVRVFATIAVLAPMAFVMGFCFPTGIRVLASDRQAWVPWAYGVNGAASVLGSVLAVCLAMTLGFSNVQWVAAGLYVIAALLMRRMAASPPEEATA